jgi:outer membrane immunogenic protein
MHGEGVMMRKLLGAVSLSAAILGVWFGSASAADMEVKAPPPPPPPVYSWTGFYFGGHIGGDWDNDRFHFVPAGTSTSNSASSVFGGGQVGYNYQISRWVLGLEGDGSWTNLSSGAPCPNPFFTCSHSIDWLASLRGRVGYLATDQSLFYVTGGAGFSEINHTALPPGVAPFIFTGFFSNTSVGYTVGGGWEYAFAKHWSVRVEYLYYGFGTSTAPPGTLSAANSTRVTNNINTVDVGVNYHF